MPLVGVVRAEFLRARNFDFVRGPRLGVGDLTIMWRHVLPNAMVAAMTYMPFHPHRGHHRADRARLPRLRPARGRAVARRLLGQAKANLHAPWIGISVF
jgi:microcin C transport system permease protein